MLSEFYRRTVVSMRDFYRI